jgi:hypothetical protein
VYTHVYTLYRASDIVILDLDLLTIFIDTSMHSSNSRRDIPGVVAQNWGGSWPAPIGKHQII